LTHTVYVSSLFRKNSQSNIINHVVNLSDERINAGNRWFCFIKASRSSRYLWPCSNNDFVWYLAQRRVTDRCSALRVTDRRRTDGSWRITVSVCRLYVFANWSWRMEDY